MKEKLETRMEPGNMMDKFAVVVVKSGTMVGHIMKGETGRFLETILVISVMLKLLVQQGIIPIYYCCP